MPRLRFPLEAGGPDRVELSYTGRLRDIQVRVDGVEAGRFENVKQLKDPARLQLPDGATLEIQFLKNRFELRRNGELLHNRAAARTTVTVAFVIALLKGGVGLLLVILLSRRIQARLGEGWMWAAVAEASAFLVLALFIRRRSKVALGLATGLTGLDLAGYGIEMLSGQLSMFIGVWFNFLFLMAFIRAFRAVGELAADAAAAAARAQGQASAATAGK